MAWSEGPRCTRDPPYRENGEPISNPFGYRLRIPILTQQYCLWQRSGRTQVAYVQGASPAWGGISGAMLCPTRDDVVVSEPA
ncbi:hypothetical protein M407DRAFT_139112 [Tulasnella calospora MUT 4182]|uniref:Uncharacterized protein n=1 Tax=Tulasnella calospora MUT 4182 TaxID=1051891 RepID=A0A0C3QSY3_9AGAM|nr:hypothetical protein M407DRAFT_139112 [Tulasnella calospora MUT 4182]